MQRQSNMNDIIDDPKKFEYVRICELYGTNNCKFVLKSDIVVLRELENTEHGRRLFPNANITFSTED